MSQNDENLQIRLTQEDVMKAQIDLMNTINDLISGTPYLKTNANKTEFYKLLSYALLSQAAESKIRPMIQIKGTTYRLAASVHHFGVNLMYIEGEEVMIQGNKVKSVTLWKILRDCLNQLYGLAQAEALSRSKEMPKGSGSTKEFDFSSGDD